MTSLEFEDLVYDLDYSMYDSSSSGFVVDDLTVNLGSNAQLLHRDYAFKHPIMVQLNNLHTFDLSSVYPSRDCKDASVVLQEAAAYLDPACIPDERLLERMLLYDMDTYMPPKSVKIVGVVVTQCQPGKPMRMNLDDLY